MFFDEHPVDLSLRKGVETGGIGTAVMNRMKKAADGDVIDSVNSYKFVYNKQGYGGGDGMKLVIASDHGGFRLKEEVKAHLTEKGIEFTDYGTHTPERCDYPLIAEKAARAVADGTFDKGILLRNGDRHRHCS